MTEANDPCESLDVRDLISNFKSNNSGKILLAASFLNAVKYDNIPFSKMEQFLEALAQACEYVFRSASNAFDRANIQVLDVMYSFYYGLLAYATEAGALDEK